MDFPQGSTDKTMSYYEMYLHLKDLAIHDSSAYPGEDLRLAYRRFYLLGEEDVILGRKVVSEFQKRLREKGLGL